MTDLRTCLVGVLALIVGCQSALADGFIIIDRPVPIPPPPHHHHPRPPRPIHQFLPLEVKNHFVTVKIDGQVAVTSVDQTFYNPSGQRLEGTYLFPIPKGAEIDKFEMDVNGEMMEAELLDAGKARRIYEDIVRRAKDPALMEYAGQGLFKVRIFPIEPRSDKRVKLKYTQILKRDGRMHRIHLSSQHREILIAPGRRGIGQGGRPRRAGDQVGLLAEPRDRDQAQGRESCDGRLRGEGTPGPTPISNSYSRPVAGMPAQWASRC